MCTEGYTKNIDCLSRFVCEIDAVINVAKFMGLGTFLLWHSFLDSYKPRIGATFRWGIITLPCSTMHTYKWYAFSRLSGNSLGSPMEIPDNNDKHLVLFCLIVTSCYTVPVHI